TCLNRICNIQSGICTNCAPSYYGKKCDKTCPDECLNGTCNSSSGICQECALGVFGKFCENNCSNECLNGICYRSSGICKDCKRTYLEGCSIRCGQGCRQRNGFPQCNRQSGKCLHGCTPGWSGRFCGDVSSLQTTTTESTDKDHFNSLTSTMIVISAILTVVVIVVGSVCFLLARKGFIRQQNNRMEPGSVFPDGVPPTQQPSGSRRRHSSNVYADINEETMEYYHYICEQNSPDNYDEINVTNDPDFEIVHSKEFTDESDSRRSVTKSEGKYIFDSTEDTVRGVTQFNGDLDHVCRLDSTSEEIPKRSDIKSNSSIEFVGTNDVLDIEAHGQTTKAESRQMQAAKYCNEVEDIFGDLGQFKVDYIHAIAKREMYVIGILCWSIPSVLDN
ncbi:hypothetical protein MAR_002350, partial [Mya arenaria]